MKTIFKIMTIVALISLNACNYLDVVPDNIATIDNAFSNRNQAEKYLYTCYSYRPPIGHIDHDPAMFGGDEVWQYYPTAVAANRIYNGTQIARGLQNSNSPWANYWNGENNNGKSLWRGIRDCNIFLENIDKVMDIQPYEKTRWVAEAKFLKAYYHYYLFKCYGPIPIVDVNLSISADVDEVKVYREPVDKVVEYISNLVLEVVPDLPESSQILEGTEAGRIDKLAALGMRAEMLVFAASPLFNGNTDYAKTPLDKRTGEPLFNQTYDVNKWKVAADACKELIDLCHAQGKSLYRRVHNRTVAAPAELQLQTVYRNAICDRWNEELIWGGTNNDCAQLSKVAHARIMRMAVGNIASVTSEYCPTLKTVEAYYSSNGVPVGEDTQWSQNGWYSNRYAVRDEPSSGTPEIYYVKEGQKTVYLHYNREPRFYASIGFDRGIYYGSGYYDFPGNVKHYEGLNLEYSGINLGSQFSWTGYSAKKMHSFEVSVETNSVILMPNGYYPFPILRLADLYLMYAEALNEYAGPGDEVYSYLDLIRDRAGLEGVVDSWTKYSTRPTKPETQDGLREIIHQERTIELALEGKRFWDVRRWKKISELNDQPRGWNIYGETREDYYRVLEVARVPVNFTVRDYFWPIKESDITTNKNLVQNYGW
jgi:hypothetical protein